VSEPQYKLRMILEAPFGGKSYEVIMPIDTFTAHDRYVGLSPPDEFDGRDFNATVQVIKTREYRKEDFRRMAIQLATNLGERMEDEEGWHGVSRQAHYERERCAGIADYAEERATRDWRDPVLHGPLQTISRETAEAIRCPPFTPSPHPPELSEERKY
jgi:hypothetical protein